MVVVGHKMNVENCLKVITDAVNGGCKCEPVPYMGWLQTDPVRRRIRTPKFWISTEDGIANIDLNGHTTVVGPTSVGMLDIAFSPNGDLFGVRAQNLYKIEKQTGNTTLIGGDLLSDALTFSPDGTLYTTLQQQLATIDPTTGLKTILFPLNWDSSGDLAFINGYLYLSARTLLTDLLIRIDPLQGTQTVVGDIGIKDVFGMSSPDNINLYGVSDQTIFSINTNDATVSNRLSYSPLLNGPAFGMSFDPTNPYF